MTGYGCATGAQSFFDWRPREIWPFRRIEAKDLCQRRCGPRHNLRSHVADFRTVKRNPGHLMILQRCDEDGLDFDARAGWLNRSIFCLAAAAGNNEIVEYMIRRNRPENPFAWASLGEVDSLRDYAAGHDLSALTDENGFNLLFHCA